MAKLLVSAGIKALRLDEASIRESAEKETGLHDYGDPYYKEGLTCITESAERDANLHPLGRFMTRDIITNYLAQRLWLVEKHEQDPDLFTAPLYPPLIITGPRRLPYETPLSGLSLTGHWTQPGSGILTVVLSGVNAARYVLGKNMSKAIWPLNF